MTIYELSVPPSANRLFANAKGGKGRVKASAYRAWIRGELKALMAQRARPVGARASVSITLPNTTRGDADNRCKAVLDILVRADVLTDDSRQQLASVTIGFGEVKLMQVEVVPSVPLSARHPNDTLGAV